MQCPNCKAEMTAMSLEARLGAALAVNICSPCRAFWFDNYETLQLSPASTLKLIKLIGGQSASAKTVIQDDLNCPRCAGRLKFTHDMQRNTHFTYWRCEAHGRFTLFFDFLLEKNFIRVLSPAEIAQLRQNIQTVNCSNCGAAIDLAAGTVCAHCGSPVSMLDMKQPQELMAQLQRACEPRPIDPALPLQLAQAKNEVERSFGGDNLGPDFWSDASSSGLVQAGLSAVARWLSKSGI